MKKTALNDLHKELGGKMVEFAGYEMPIQYSEGIMAEHSWVRENAGLFDVSHMGQAILEGEGTIEFFEKITPSPFTKTPYNKAKYTVLLNSSKTFPLIGGVEGGIIDDLIITKLADDKFFLVYNAGCKEKDEKFIQDNLTEGLTFTPLPDRSLIALQGPKAEEVMHKTPLPEGGAGGGFLPEEYMTFKATDDIYISRLGYTGEDGFEISIPSEKATEYAKDLLKQEETKPIGLGARDSLRLEMGYPLYGHDIDENTNPMEADLGWVVAKANKSKYENPQKKRVGVELLEKGIVREGAKIFALDGNEIGVITSGGFSPTLQKPIAQGYVKAQYSEANTEVNVELRGKMLKAKICSYVFLKPRTKK